MKADQYVGKIFTHCELGKVAVDSKLAKSRTLVEVTVIDRGAGWDEIKQSYTGVKHTVLDNEGGAINNWSRGENRQFGFKDVVHFNTLN